MIDAPFVSAGQVAARALDALIPPRRVTVSQYALEHRRLQNEGGGYVGRWTHDIAPYLVEPMDCLTSLDYLTTAIVGPGQSGKALALDTPIPVPTGWSTMGDLRVGDEVFDEAGRVCRVTFVTNTMTEHQCYRIVFSDGTSIVADAEHLWAVETHARPRRPDGSRFHVWDAKRLLTTEQIAQKHAKGSTDTDNPFAVRVAGALQLPDVGLPVDPYVLGVWLGDGHSASAQITLHENDFEITDAIAAAGYPVEKVNRSETGVLTLKIRAPGWDLNFCSRGHDRRVKVDYAWGGCRECGQQDSKYRQYGTPRDEPQQRDTFSKRLADIGVLGNKHIPAMYLRASYAQRLALLQGLLDTDGTIHTKGSRASFCSTVESLALATVELARSLGFKPTIRTRMPNAIVGSVAIPGAMAYQVDFTAYAETRVFRLTRKFDRQISREGRRTTETERRRIIAVEEIASVPVRCIQVDSNSHLYLAGEAMVPTHNTEVAQNWLLKSVADDPGDFLWYMQTDPGLEAYVKGRINPMIDSHEELRGALGQRSIDDSLHFKRFRGMKIEFLSATYSNLINKSAPRIVADEIDAYPDNIGDIKTLLDIRRQTFGRQSMICAISHPDLARGVNPDRDWTAGVMAIYGDSDRRVWYWCCPHCGAWSSPCPIADRHMTLHYPVDGTLDEIERETRLLCPVSGCLIENTERSEMNRTGRWIGLGQTMQQDGTVIGELTRAKTAGFWIVGAMSPFVLGGIGALARARVKAERELEISGDDNTLRQVMVKQWGIPYAPPRVVGSVDANELAARAERALGLGVVPRGVRFLTAVADCQLSHFEWLVRGWGERGESWVIDKGRLPADPATSADDWDALLATVFQRTYPLDDESGRRMPIRGCGFDSGGQAGVTQQAYAAWTRWSRTRHEDGEHKVPTIRFFGESDGRKVYSIVPMKGNDRLEAKNLDIVWPETARAANRKAGGGTVPVAMFNPNQYKDDVIGQLSCAEAGPLYVHFPHALRSKEAPHVWFEQLTSEAKDSGGRWRKINANARNEALDLMVMSHVIAKYHGLNRIDWTKPPSFARDWDDNPMIIAPVKVIEEVVTVESGETVVVERPKEQPELKSRTTPTATTARKSLINRFA